MIIPSRSVKITVSIRNSNFKYSQHMQENDLSVKLEKSGKILG